MYLSTKYSFLENRTYMFSKNHVYRAFILNYILQDYTVAVQMQKLFLSLFCFYYVI